jgi:Zn-dependent protease with chaperone function
LWREGSTTHPSIAAEFEWALGTSDVIHLGQTRDLDDDALFFLVAHELGHSYHGHGREFVAFFATEADKALPDLALVQKYAAHAMANVHQAGPLKHRQEFEADAFAVRVMLAYGLDPLSAMRGLLKGQFASVVHPSRRARLDNAAALIATSNVTKVAARD